MRWKYPKDGDQRIVTRFCVLPLSFNGTTYWLEFVKMKQFYWGAMGEWIISQVLEK